MGFLSGIEQGIGKIFNGGGANYTPPPTGGFTVGNAAQATNQDDELAQQYASRGLIAPNMGASNAAYGQAGTAYGQSQQDAGQQAAANGLLSSAAMGGQPSAAALGGAQALGQNIQAQLAAGGARAPGLGTLSAQAQGAGMMGAGIGQAGAARGQEVGQSMAANYGGASALTGANINEQGLSANQGFQQGQLANQAAGIGLSSQSNNDAMNDYYGKLGLGYAQLGNQDATGAYNAGTTATEQGAQSNQTTGGQVISTASKLAALSDARLKTDIEPLDGPNSSSSDRRMGDPDAEPPPRKSLDELMQGSFTPKDTGPDVPFPGADSGGLHDYDAIDRETSARNAGIDPDEVNPWAQAHTAATGSYAEEGPFNQGKDAEYHEAFGPASKKTGNPVDAFMDAMHPVSFRYKTPMADPEGTQKQRVGIMAQDAQQTPVGQSMISQTPMGLAIQPQAGLSVALASIARLNDRIEELERGKSA
jgi:hypothetical protein